MKPIYLFTTAVGSVCALSPTAPAVANNHTTNLTIEEVMVTANRRQESAQDVAISITAMSGDQIEKMGFQDMVQITQQVPNFTSQGLFGPSGPPFLNIRGISFIDYSDANESSVGLYVDDIYYGAQGAASGQLFDLERVEVLRGPQGTLFGRNTTGGLVHYITRKPGDTLQAEASVQLGSYQQRIVQAALGGPITDRFGVRVAIKSNRDEGWQTNEITNTSWAKTDVTSGRITAVLAPTDSLDATFSYHYSDSDSTMVGYALYGNRVPSDLLTACAIEAVQASQCANRDGFRDSNPNPTDIFSEADNYPNTYTSQGGLITVNWGADNLAFASVTGYEQYERFTQQDIDASDNTLNQVGEYESDISHYSQEFRLSGHSDSIKWVGGLYYYTDDRYRSSSYLINTIPVQTGPADLSTDSTAAFIQTDWSLSDRWTLITGIRYTDETRELNNLRNVNALGESLLFDENGPLESHQEKLSTDNFTYKLSLQWHPIDDLMTYLQYSTGFKSGGINPSLVNDIKLVGPVGEEKLSALELGFKSTSLNSRLRVNSAVFYYDFQDYQALAGVTINNAPASIFLNAGDASVLGAELELTFLAGEHWEISLGLGALDTEFSAASDVTIDGRQLDGNELPSAPAWNTNASVRYSRALKNAGNLELQASMTYQDDIYFGPDNNPSEIQEGYGIVNLRAGWASDNSQLRLEAFIDNALDEEYHIQKFESSGAFFDAAYGVWGRPRMAGVKLSYTY